MSAIRNVGIVGLGKMGAPMARHLLANGFTVTGCDPLDAARRNARALGVSVLGTPREVAQTSDLVIVIVGFDHEVEAAVFGEDGIAEGARNGLVVAVGSTVTPRYARRLAARLLEKGVVALDIPSARGEADRAAPQPAALRHGEGDHQGTEDPASAWDCRAARNKGVRTISGLPPSRAGNLF